MTAKPNTQPQKGKPTAPATKKNTPKGAAEMKKPSKGSSCCS